MKFKIRNLKFKIDTEAFSLIELLVAVSIFSVICIIAMGALYSVQNVNTRTQQTQIILDGMNLSMEQMVRDIRYGSVFNCNSVTSNFSSQITPASCPYSSSSVNGTLVFKPSGGGVNDRIAYYISNGHIRKYNNVSNLDTQVTSDDVKIQALHFFVTGAEGTQSLPVADYEQPLITIVVSGVTVPPKATVSPVKFNLQTSVSARLLDN